MGITSTRRTAVLALVVCALVLSVTVPLRTFLEQRHELSSEQQQQQQLEQRIDKLEQRKARLQDPAQVKTDAKRRLGYVEPGEIPYVVGQRSGATPPPSRGGANPGTDRKPWYGRTWEQLNSPSGADSP